MNVPRSVASARTPQSPAVFGFPQTMGKTRAPVDASARNRAAAKGPAVRATASNSRDATMTKNARKVGKLKAADKRRCVSPSRVVVR